MKTQINEKLLKEINEARNVGYESAHPEFVEQKHNRRFGDRRKFGRRNSNGGFEIKSDSNKYSKLDKFVLCSISAILVICTTVVLFSI